MFLFTANQKKPAVSNSTGAKMGEKGQKVLFCHIFQVSLIDLFLFFNMISGVHTMCLCVKGALFWCSTLLFIIAFSPLISLSRSGRRVAFEEREKVGKTFSRDLYLTERKQDERQVGSRNAIMSWLQSYGRNDRNWNGGGAGQRVNVHAPPKLTPAQRRARGPLPDWDDIQVYTSFVVSDLCSTFAVATERRSG